MRMQPRRDIVTEPELAKELRISVRALINYRNQRLIPHIRLGRSVRYDRAAVEKALAKLTITEIA
jgi:predicted DNA-binding transcriptional regulator AlpA